MVEGNGIHRLANVHRKTFVGHTVNATSPNSRFAQGANKINGTVLTQVEAHGKNLFFFFRNADTHTKCTHRNKNTKRLGRKLPDHVVHIHLGMAGRIPISTIPGPEVKNTTRLRLIANDISRVADVSAMICNYGTYEYYQDVLKRLGPDPLRNDADSEAVWEVLQKKKTSIGHALLDQSIVAGIGNIYRAEILHLARIHPQTKCSDISKQQWDDIWAHSQRIMRQGVRLGRIITIREDESAGKPLSSLKGGQGRYIYNRTSCRRCNGNVKKIDFGARFVYLCENCQPAVVADRTLNIQAAHNKVPQNSDTVDIKRKGPDHGNHDVIEASAQALYPDALDDSGVVLSDDEDTQQNKHSTTLLRHDVSRKRRRIRAFA